jgi:hypothetical protein
MVLCAHALFADMLATHNCGHRCITDEKQIDVDSEFACLPFPRMSYHA